MKIYIKTFIASLAITALLSGCGGGAGNQANVSANSSATPIATREAEKPTPSVTPAATPAVIEATASPVEYTYLGITPSKDGFSYKIRVNTTKPVSQVDIDVKYTDAAGKTLEETTVAWQNIVKSARQPIEQGKSYEAEGYLPEGATKVESKLKRVIFADGTRWEAK